MQSTAQPAAQQDALARWSQVPKWLDDEIANLQEGLKQGYSAPKGNVKSVIEQVDAMLAAPVKDSPFVQMAKADAPAAFRKQARGAGEDADPSGDREVQGVSDDHVPARRA